LRNLRSLLPIAALSVTAAAHAQFSFSNINATYAMNPDSGTIPWIVTPDTSAMTIDFTQNAPAFKVGDSTRFLYGVSVITYDVTSPVAIESVDLTLQGDVEQYGEIQYGEGISSGANSLGSVTGLLQGSSYAGGLDGAFTKTVHLDFSQSVTSFSVTQTLASDIGNETVPSASLALVGTVEQNFNPVPEPATLSVLGVGALALLRRRMRR